MFVYIGFTVAAIVVNIGATVAAVVMISLVRPVQLRVGWRVLANFPVIVAGVVDAAKEKHKHAGASCGRDVQLCQLGPLRIFGEAGEHHHGHVDWALKQIQNTKGPCGCGLSASVTDLCRGPRAKVLQSSNRSVTG